MDDGVGLINMNARMYDARLGRFLQPDPYVQYPETTQGFNRYTYVENNPLSYTDPTGNFLHGDEQRVTGIDRDEIESHVAEREVLDGFESSDSSEQDMSDIEVIKSSKITAVTLGSDIKVTFRDSQSQPNSDKSNRSELPSFFEVTRNFLAASWFNPMEDPNDPQSDPSMVKQSTKNTKAVVAGVVAIAVPASIWDLFGGKIVKGLKAIGRGIKKGLRKRSVAKGATRTKKVEPIKDAGGPHTTWKADPQTGEITRHETWTPNPRNPRGWDKVQSTDLKGAPHINKQTGEAIPTPHTQGKAIPGGVRPADPSEIPRGNHYNY